ncbi:hypothetical protein KHQ81_07085 [Mycoplasmatota bacterium]|nr:hypothetical protein KHQ81_07085 [Mycoplasmatota bacterium]
MVRKPKLLKMFVDTYISIAFFSLIIATIALVQLLIIQNEPINNSENGLYKMFIIIWLLSASMFLYRIMYIKTLFKTGIPIKGFIIQNDFYNRGKITYSYWLIDRSYKRSLNILGKCLTPGTNVTILVDKKTIKGL